MSCNLASSAPQWRVTSEYNHEQTKALKRLHKQPPCPTHRHVLYQSTTTLRWQVYCLLGWRFATKGNTSTILVRLQFRDHSNPRGFEVPLSSVTWGMSEDLLDEIMGNQEVVQ